MAKTKKVEELEKIEELVEVKENKEVNLQEKEPLTLEQIKNMSHQAVEEYYNTK